MLRVVPYAAFHFTAYEKFRGLLAKQLYGSETRHHHIPPWLDLLAGSAAGGAAVLLTYPLDLVRTRLAYGSERKGVCASHTLCTLFCQAMLRSKLLPEIIDCHDFEILLKLAFLQVLGK